MTILRPPEDDRWFSKTTPPPSGRHVWVFGSDALGEYKQLAYRLDYKGKGAKAFIDPNTKARWRFLTVSTDAYIHPFDSTFWCYPDEETQ